MDCTRSTLVTVSSSPASQLRSWWSPDSSARSRCCLPGLSIQPCRLRAQAHKTGPLEKPVSYHLCFSQMGYKFGRGFPQPLPQVW